jgi:hypothetical protein
MKTQPIEPTAITARPFHAMISTVLARRKCTKWLIPRPDAR